MFFGNDAAARYDQEPGNSQPPRKLVGNCMQRRVVKLGGSLLDLPDLVPRLRAWLARQTPADTVIVVGGGALVDVIRQWQRRFEFSQHTAHWLSIRAMSLSAAALQSVLPEAELLTAVEPWREQAPRARLAVLEPWRFLREEEPRLTTPPLPLGERRLTTPPLPLGEGRGEGDILTALPETWDVTSDSIAARLADIAHRAELVLLKSAAPPAGTLQELARAGYVDAFFPQAAARLSSVRYENLRARSATR